MIKHLALALALAAPLGARGEFISGNQLLAGLSDGSPSADALGYIAGVFDSGLGVLHCAPAGVSLGQVADMVKATLTDLPTVRHRPGHLFVLYALRDAWPCPERRTPPARCAALEPPIHVSQQP